MVQLKPAPTYVPVDPAFRPLPRNGHYGVLEPGFDEVLKAADAAVAPMWQPELPLEGFRQAWLAPMPAPAGTPREGEDVITEKRKIPMRDGAEIEIKIYRSKEAAAAAKEGVATGKKGAVIGVRFHGGGWMVGGHCTEEPENLMLAAVGVVVVSVDYRMAPEYKFPIPVDDCLDATKWCKTNAASLGADPERIVLLGSSGGASLATATAFRLRDEGVSGLLAQVLSYPVTCHPAIFPKDKYEFGSYQQHAGASIVNAVKMEFFWDAYLPGPPASVEPKEWHSPLLAKSLKGLPPVLMQVAGADPLRDEAIAFAERLKEGGVPTELHVYKGMPHCFYAFDSHPSTAEYYRRVVDYLKGIVDGSADNAKL